MSLLARFAGSVRRLRAKKGFSQKVLADSIGISVSPPGAAQFLDGPPNGRLVHQRAMTECSPGPSVFGAPCS
jgi:hypothetical protein